MKVELEREEAHSLMALIVERLLDEGALADKDRAALRRWRSENMTAGSDGMIELTTKVNADIERALKTKAKSAVMKPDWR